MTTSPRTRPLPSGTVVPLDDRRSRRRDEHDRGRPAGRPELPGPGISMTVYAGVPIIACEGPLGTDSVRDCSQVFAAAVRLRPRSVVVDLTRATVDDESVPVLGLMRHFAARHGIHLALAAVPPRGMDALHRAEVASLYDVHATLPLAMAAAVARLHRSLPHREAGH